VLGSEQDSHGRGRAEPDNAGGGMGELQLSSPSSSSSKTIRHDLEGDTTSSTGTSLAADATTMPSMAESSYDRYVVSAIFCLLGVGLLLPWNAFISAEPYFHSRLCSSSSSGGDGGGNGIELYFGLVFNACGFLSLIVVLALRRRSTSRTRTAPRTRTERSEVEEDDNNDDEEESVQQHHSRSSARKQVLWSLSLYFIMFLLTTIVVLVENIHPDVFLVVTLVCLALFGVCLALAGTGVVAVAGIFPPRVAIAPFFAGQAAGGVFISISNFLTEYALGSPENFWKEHCHGSNNFTSTATTYYADDLWKTDCPPYSTDWATFWYFSLGCSILAACIIGFAILERLEITAHYRQMAQYGATEMREEREGSSYNDLTQPLLSGTDDEPSTATRNVEGEGGTLGSVRAIAMPAVAIHLTAFVTLAIFPAWTSKIESSGLCVNRGRLQNDLFEPLGFVMFNVPDLLARLLGPLAVDVDKLRKVPWVLAVCAASRLVFLPLFLFCKSSTTAIPSIDSDYYTLLVAICFAFSNGLLMSFSFMIAPQLLSPAEDVQQLGSELMNFSLASGLLGGSCFSFVYNMLATGR